jgi:pimeloyl-ACP methyl ester carboxylesterase
MRETRLEIARLPYMIAYAEASPFKDTYGGDVGHVFVEAMVIRPRDLASKTVIVFSHPIGGGSFLPIMTALAARGHHVLYVNTRYRGNDSALIVEHCVRDLGAAIADARTRFGYERIVLGGWSGGGSLALFYQEQAERPTVTTTPAGDPADLVGAGLVPGDGIFLVAAHVGRSVTLTEWIDASVVDEAHPELRAPELDLYDPANPAQPPYRPEFVARYRAAQVARNERITRFAEGMLDELRRSGRPNAEHCFVVHRTMADPRWLDLSVDPNGRKPRWCYLGDPETVNDGPVGLARFTTLRSWLSQWSLRTSRAHGERNAANTSVPTLVVGNGADDACTPSHTRRLFEAIPHRRKSMHEIEGASHYYVGQRAELAACIGHYERWLDEHRLMERAR